MAEEPGAPVGSYALSGFDNVNLFNGHLNFRLPLMRIGGRGSAGYTMTLPIEQHWLVQTIPQPHCDQSGCTYNPADYRYIANPIWWTGIQAGYGPGVLQGRQTGDDLQSAPGCGSGVVFHNTLTRLTFTSPDATEYEFRDLGTDGQPTTGGPPGCFEGFNRGKVFATADGSAVTFVSDVDIKDYRQPPSGPANLIYPSGYMMLRDGTRYRIDNGRTSWIRDTNGNRVQFTYDGSGTLTAVDDSLNRHVSITYGNGPDVISFKGMGGATRTIKVYHDVQHNVLRKHPDGSTEYTIKTFQQLYPDLQNPQQGNCDLSVVSAVELPDGRQYQFRYDSYANLAEVFLPTGGRFEYDWSNGTYNFGDYIWGIWQRVLERRTALDVTTSTYETRMTYSIPSSGPITVDTLDPKNGNALLARSKHYFSGSSLPSLLAKGTDYPKWQDGQEYQTEEFATDGTTVLRRLNKTYQQRASVGWWSGGATDAPPKDPRLVESTLTLVDTNQVSKQSSTNPNTGTVGFDQYNNQTDVWEYDFGPGAPGPLLRHTVNSYLTAGYDSLIPNSSSPNVSLTYHIRSLPTQVSLYDSDGTERGRTTFEYDNYINDSFHAALLDRPNISGHDSAVSTGYLTRGNLTGVSRYLLPTGTAITTYSQFDIAGNVIKVIDPRSIAGNIIATTIGYDDNFGGPDGSLAEHYSFTELGSQQTFAFPTQVTNAKSQSAYSQYSYYLGLAINQQDFNGIVVAGYHSDLLDRLTQVRRAYGTSAENQITFEYDDPNHAITTKRDLSINGDSALIGKVIYDGLGRTIESRQYEDGTNYIATQTQYDAANRAYRKSSPFRPWQSETAIWTTSSFDGLGRINRVTTPDSAIMMTSYSGNSTTATDQANKSRKSVTDALGRLTDVYEDPAGLNYQTSYAYDVLDNLIKVTQSTQQRFFMYDSLSRLIRARNPEQGTNSSLNLTDPLTSNSTWSTAYQYDPTRNLLVKTDARGVSTHFEYDALNRNTRRWYNGSSSTLSTTHNNPVLPSDVGVTDETKFYYDAQTLPSGAPSYSRGSAVGRLVAQVYGTGSNGDYFAYDVLGRLTLKYQQIGAINYQLSVDYNLAGGIKTLTYPSVRTVTNSYDSAGRLTDLSGNLGDGTVRTYATGILYSPFGGQTKEQFGTSPTSVYNKLFYNSRGQLSEIRVSTSYTGPADTTWNRGAIINHYSEQCWGMCGGNNSTSQMTDNNGNLKKQEVYIPNDDQITGYTQRWQQYDYDSLNRLNWVREIKDNLEQWKQQFTYDRWGNRTINTGVTYGVGINNKTFTVDTGTNRLTVPVGQSGTMTYDAAGNLTNDTYTGAGNRTYDGENKITSATGSSSQTEVYAYDASGQRIKRTVDGVTTWQVYGFGGELLAEYTPNGAANSPQKEYGYRNGQLLVMAEPASGPQNVTWTNATGVSISGNSLTKTATDDWYNARASSTQRLSTGDGYVEFTASETNTYRMVGLGEYGSGAFNYGNLRYMFYVAASGTLYAEEYGTLTNVGTYATGDTLRVAIEAGVVKYRKNGTVVYTSSLAPVYPLYADATLYTNGSTLTNVKFSSGSGGSGAKIQWLITDQLGTPRMILDATGALANMKRHDYLPFGEELFVPTSGRIAAQGYASGDGVRQQFTSYERDNETSLDYAINRYYSWTQGRFTSSDPLMGSGKTADPQTWNRYTYCGNKPLTRVDVNGLDWWYDSAADGDGAMPVWKARDPGGTWRRWSNTYSMVYYDSGAKKWAALDPNGNRAYVGDSQESAERAFEIFAGPAHDSGLTNSERDFFAGVTSGLHPLGFLYTPFLEANGVDTTSREFAWGAGFAALGSFTSSVTATGGGTIRVGRWMSQAEYKAMSNSGVVQESLLNGVTSVSIPADINAFRNPAARSVFVEFDVPRSAIRTQTQGWGKIYGPNSIFGKRLGITEMPPATNIEPKVSNLKQGW